MQSAIKGSDVQILSDLTSDIVNDCHSPFVPLYIHKLFANICAKTKKIEVSLRMMTHDKEWIKWKEFGYKKLKPLFFVDDACVNYVKISKIFNKELKQIVIFSHAHDKYNESIHLNDIFLEQILFAIEEISQNVSLSSIFEEILIVNPFDSIQEFIEKERVLFIERGWKL